ncbi:MAG TPA: lamin tail domain-containing protein, partial [Candidatus Dormibacteraeota bacterium]|nr:lamin tail domain-containing protein [Candidatus Dormibacteraeota bacterium]
YGVPGQFVFEFPAPATGQVDIAFAPNHGITDLASPPNAFAGAQWSVTYDPNGLPATFLITEFMAANTKTLNDEDGDQPDWIEIYNPRDGAGNLEGWFLTDDAANLTKWRFPNRTIESKVYMVVFASGKNRTNATGNLHTSFQLNNSGEYLALVDPATNIVSAFSPTYPLQQPDVSYGRDPSNPNFVGYFATPTPRARNSVGGTGFAPEVQFSDNSRTFVTNQPFALTLSTPLAGATIYYAFGTNVPSSSSTNSRLYATPIQITNTASVRARAFATGLLPGPISTKTYIGLANQTNIIGFNSDLPVMILHNYGRGTVPASKADQYVLLQTFETPCGRSSMTNPPTLSARGRFHVRGSSTAVDSTSKSAFFL